MVFASEKKWSYSTLERSRLLQLLLIFEELKHEKVVGPDGIPFALHLLDGFEQGELLSLHHVGEDENDRSGNTGKAMQQSTSAVRLRSINGTNHTVELFLASPGGLSK